ncbi:MAG: PEP-CTERM sorting domain-containing protein [Verrucomicrobiales bacterium]
MKRFLYASLVLGSKFAFGGTILYTDDFNVPDNASFDASYDPARDSGLLDGEVVLRSWGAQQQILGNAAYHPGITGGLRFEAAAGPFGSTNRYDWAGGSAAALIAADGGLRVEFDWIPATYSTNDPDNEPTDWISLQVGGTNADPSTGNLTWADYEYGILLRNNGGSEIWQNGGNMGAGGSFTETPAGLARRVQIDFLPDSFAPGSSVRAVTSVNGMLVQDDTFTWDSASGEIYIDFGHNALGASIDNLVVSTVPEPGVLALSGLGLLALGRRRVRSRS